MAGIPKVERFAEFFKRLAAAPAASGRDQALRQIANILDAVEDEFSGIAYDPTTPYRSGRMYAPQPDARRPVPGRSDAIRFESRKHSTVIADNGAIRVIMNRGGGVVLDKPGADGRTV